MLWLRRTWVFEWLWRPSLISYYLGEKNKHLSNSVIVLFFHWGSRRFTLRSALGLFLALCSEETHVSACFCCWWWFWGLTWCLTRLLLAGLLRGPHEMLRIEPESAMFKTNALLTVLLLQPLNFFLRTGEMSYFAYRRYVFDSQHHMVPWALL